MDVDWGEFSTCDSKIRLCLRPAASAGAEERLRIVSNLISLADGHVLPPQLELNETHIEQRAA